ncbi:MAG: DUF4259 domain-containing protein [Dactylosporangium sp.]|nr:DUF4259 domain-containing protein [Dactylosporangium sp.]
MGTWHTGPFDNDTAADWCGALDDVAPGRRIEFLREALTAVLEEDEYLDSDPAVEAIAAAAIVASQLPGGPAIDSPYAPDFLLNGGTLEIPEDLPSLALRALDRVAGDDSEWRGLWEDADLYPDAVAALQPIRTTLERAIDSRRSPGTSSP